MNNRHQKLEQVLHETAADFLNREATRQSLVTVTRAQLSDNNKSAVVYVSVLPESEERAAVDFANRHRSEFARYFESRVRGARCPHVEFAIDEGEKSRRRLDELTN